MVPVPAQRNGDRAAGCGGITVGTQNQDGVVGERPADRGYPPAPGICGICGIWGICGGETVCVTVLVLVLVLTDVLMLGSVVVVIDGVVSVLVDGAEVVCVAVWVGATTCPDVVSVVVVLLVSVVPDDESDIRLTTNHTISASKSAISAPNPIRAAGLRYQGTGGSGGWPGCGSYAP